MFVVFKKQRQKEIMLDIPLEGWDAGILIWKYVGFYTDTVVWIRVLQKSMY